MSNKRTRYKSAFGKYRRLIGIAVGLLLGWYAAGYDAETSLADHHGGKTEKTVENGESAGKTEKNDHGISDKAHEEKDGHSDKHDVQDKHDKHDEHAHHGHDEHHHAETAAKKLVPTDAENIPRVPGWYTQGLMFALALFAVGIFLYVLDLIGIGRFGTKGPEPMKIDHSHDDHSHDEHGDDQDHSHDPGHGDDSSPDAKHEAAKEGAPEEAEKVKDEASSKTTATENDRTESEDESETQEDAKSE